MKYVEYGLKQNKTIMLLHGGGLAPWNYSEEAEQLQDRYHIIIPILDGHSGSDKNFTTIENNGDEIIAYIDQNLNGKVFMICGLSLGGQILTDILAKRKDICKYAIIESALVLPMKMTYALIQPVFSICYVLIKKRWFAQLQFATVYKGNIIKNLIMDCQSYTKYRPNETTGGIFVSWRRKEELPTGA